MNYKIVTFGCQMNVHESQKLAGIFESRGFSPTQDSEDADAIVFNTCCIREGAEDRALGNIGALKQLKAKKPSLIVGVCGCMSQQSGVAQSIARRFPFVDIIVGTHNIHNFAAHLDAKLNGAKKCIIDVWEKEREIVENQAIKRDKAAQAYVNISFGCNNFCSYCIVPYVRGRERSRKKADIVSEVTSLVDSGIKEIMLLGQNVNSYGQDTNDGTSFADLIGELSQISGDFWIKFMTSHPKDLTIDVVKTIAKSKKLADWIHLPMQSGSDSILRAMNRRYTSAQYLEKAAFIREFLPNAGLTSDFIVGFPSESEQDFEKTLEVVEKLRFDNIFAFIYSKRKGTPAAAMSEQIPIEIKRERIKRLLELSRRIGREKAAELIGTSMRVLGQSHKDGKISAVSSAGRVVEVVGDASLVGSFFDCQIDRTKDSRLFGKRV